jgi:hypothetical protein
VSCVSHLPPTRADRPEENAFARACIDLFTRLWAELESTATESPAPRPIPHRSDESKYFGRSWSCCWMPAAPRGGGCFWSRSGLTT